MSQSATRRLGDVCSIVGGGTPAKDRPEFYGGSIPWATVRDLNVEVLRTTEHTITSLGLSESSANLIPGGTVVIATRVGLGKVVTLAQDTAINQDLRGLVVKNPSELDSRYLFWWCRSMAPVILAAGTGATVQGVTLPFVSSLEIPLPPLVEQKHIAAKLDVVLSSVDQMGRAIVDEVRSSEDLREAVREKLLSNDGGEVTLADVCSIESVLVDPRLPEHRQQLHVGAGNIEQGSGRLADLKSAEEEELISGKHEFTQEDVLYSKIRPYLRKVAAPDFSGLCSADIYPLRPKGLIRRAYLQQVLLSSTFTQYAMEGSARAGMPKVNREHLFAYRLRLPSVSEQDQRLFGYARVCSEVDDLIRVLNAKAVKLVELRDSVLQAAFRGQL